MKTLRIALAQINPIVGDLDGNASKITDYIEKAREFGADIVVFPELSITGYPPEDLLLKPQFIKDNLDALKRVKDKTKGITAIVGFVDRRDDIYNAAAIIYDGGLIDVYHKMYLPN
ncbi:MAG: nitrilase-related carbon-nitrogen hydrolase, partial [Nitrospirota bacterium]